MTPRFRLRATALVGAINAASLTGSLAAAQPAFASGPVVQVPALTVSPLSGNATADSRFLSSIASDVGAPAGARASGASFIFQGDVNRGPIASMRTVSTPGTFGLDGQPGFTDRSGVTANSYASNLELDAPMPGLVTGIVELPYCWSGPDTSTDPCLQAAIDWNAATGAGSVLPAPVNSTVSLTASSSGSTVTLDATVKDAATGLIDPTPPGPMTFIENSTVIVGTVEVVAGHATGPGFGQWPDHGQHAGHWCTEQCRGQQRFGAAAAEGTEEHPCR